MYSAEVLERSAPALQAIEAADQLKIVRDFIRPLDERWQRAGPELPTGVMHGDYNAATNVLKDPDGIVAILDFDLLSKHERIYELAYAAFFSIGCVGWSDQFEDRAWDMIPKLLTAYSQQADVPLTEAEIEYFVDGLIRVQLFWLCTIGFQTDPFAALKEEWPALEEAQWLARNLENRLRGLWALNSA